MSNEHLDQILSIPVEELAANGKVPLEIVQDLDSLYLHFARSIANEIKARNQAGELTRIILPVGPIGQYPLLVQICNRVGISWHNVHTFNMDDYLDWQGRPLSLDHPLSFEGYMRQEVFNQLNPDLRIPDEQIHFPDPLDLDRVSQQIAAVGGIDTCYGGIGIHGHVAFNEPPNSRWYKLTPDQFRQSLTRIVSLAPETVVMNSIRATGGNLSALPPMAITLGMRDILAARRIRLYCQGGTWQRTILRIAVLGEEDVDYPVTLLQNHPDFAIITDKNTAKAPKPSITA
jgi:glucosamine-6-phosphate deaminase